MHYNVFFFKSSHYIANYRFTLFAATSSKVFSWKMVFSNEDKAVIKNDYEEKGWTAYRIWKDHPSKKWNRVSVHRLVERFKKNNTMNRQPGSGRPRTVTTEDNEDLVESLICSQEDKPGSHMSPREIEKHTGISRSSVKRMVNNRGWKQFRRVKTPQMSTTAKERRTERAGDLAKRFAHKRSIERCVWQDEKDFSLQVPLNPQNSRVYGTSQKKDIQPNRLFQHSNKQSIKVMVSACVTWNGATKPCFVNEKGLKVNATRYKKHLEKELFPEIDRIVGNKSWIFIQDSAPSHRSNLVQSFLKEKLKSRFVKSSEWPPSSPDCSRLDYHFWNHVKEKVYADRMNKPFTNEAELKRKIRKVWSEVAGDVPEIRKALKQFTPRLKAVHESKGDCIKMLFG